MKRQIENEGAAVDATSPGVGKHPRRTWLLTVLLTAAMGATVWLGLQLHALQKEMSHFGPADRRLLELAGKIIHLDEVLTMSARMAAATGEPAWETRYRRFEPQLDAAIQECRNLEPQIIGDFIAKTDAANRKLVAMENSAFDLVRGQNPPAAAAILASPEYENNKQRYAEGIRRLISALDAHVDASQEMLQRRMGLTLAALVTILIVPSFLWLALLREGRRRAEAEHSATRVAEQAREAAARRIVEERFRILFESSLDAIMTLEPPAWRFTSCNPATVSMFKAANEQDFTTREPWALSPERQPDGRTSAEKAKEMIETAMREGSRFFEWTHRRVNGEDFPATVRLTRMELAGKRFLQATVRDITESKRAEDLMRLEREVLERLNHPGKTTDAIGEILPLLRKSTGLDAVAAIQTVGRGGGERGGPGGARRATGAAVERAGSVILLSP